MDILIVAVVSAIALAAHIALFLWIRFKIDEGVICKYLQDHHALSEATARSLHYVLAAINVSKERCLKVCKRSGRIRLTEDASGAWLADSRRL